MDLSEKYDKLQTQAGLPPDSLEMGVRPPRKNGFFDITAIRAKIRATRKKVNRFLKKYEEGN